MSESATRRLRLVLAYDGTEFHGWQYQDGCRTVEGELRIALAEIAAGDVETAGASRTDTGVHALGNCALATLETRLDCTEVQRALTALTPADLAIVECREAAPDFHPRFDAVEKRYLYRVNTAGDDPVFGTRYQWWVRPALDERLMHESGQALVGEHDFAGYRNRSKDEPEDTVRRIRAVDCRRRGDHVFFQVIGEGFLYRMVRNIVGTLVEVGRGRFPPARVAEILRSGDRGEAGPSAPPEGLYLMEIAYPDTERCAISGSPPLF